MSAVNDGGAPDVDGAAGSAVCLFPQAADHPAGATAPVSEAGQLAPDIALLDAVVSGLPDPVVVLDQDGRVMAFNAEAGMVAPALRRGEPASIALRMPELVEAIRQANATGKAQRIEFSARLPIVALVGGVCRSDCARRRAVARRGCGHYRPRSHPDPAGRGHARRLRRQRQS